MYREIQLRLYFTCITLIHDFYTTLGWLLTISDRILMPFNVLTSPLQAIATHPGSNTGIRLFVKRDDLLHPDIQGNKWRKLAPVLPVVKQSFPGGIVTFGGPFSNHLQAVAAAGRVFDIPTRGIVRGLHADPDNPTLLEARNNGMVLLPVSKNEYDFLKNNPEALSREFPDCFILIFKKIGSFNPDKGSPSGWMRKIAVNSALAHYRKFHFDYEKTMELLPDNADVSSDIFSKMGFEEILTVVDTLPEGARMVFQMAVFDDFSHDEIAKILGISPGTSRSLLSRSRRLLQEKILKIQSNELARI